MPTLRPRKSNRRLSELSKDEDSPAPPASKERMSRTRARTLKKEICRTQNQRLPQESTLAIGKGKDDPAELVESMVTAKDKEVIHSTHCILLRNLKQTIVSRCTTRIPKSYLLDLHSNAKKGRLRALILSLMEQKNFNDAGDDTLLGLDKIVGTHDSQPRQGEIENVVENERNVACKDTDPHSDIDKKKLMTPTSKLESFIQKQRSRKQSHVVMLDYVLDKNTDVLDELKVSKKKSSISKEENAPKDGSKDKPKPGSTNEIKQQNSTNKKKRVRRISSSSDDSDMENEYIPTKLLSKKSKIGIPKASLRSPIRIPRVEVERKKNQSESCSVTCSQKRLTQSSVRSRVQSHPFKDLGHRKMVKGDPSVSKQSKTVLEKSQMEAHLRKSNEQKGTIDNITLPGTVPHSNLDRTGAAPIKRTNMKHLGHHAKLIAPEVPQSVNKPPPTKLVPSAQPKIFEALPLSNTLTVLLECAAKSLEKSVHEGPDFFYRNSDDKIVEALNTGARWSGALPVHSTVSSDSNTESRSKLRKERTIPLGSPADRNEKGKTLVLFDPVARVPQPHPLLFLDKVFVRLHSCFLVRNYRKILQWVWAGERRSSAKKLCIPPGKGTPEFAVKQNRLDGYVSALLSRVITKQDDDFFDLIAVHDTLMGIVEKVVTADET